MFFNSVFTFSFLRPRLQMHRDRPDGRWMKNIENCSLAKDTLYLVEANIRFRFKILMFMLMLAFPLECPCNTNKGDLHCSWNDRLSRRYDDCNAWPLDWLWGQWHCYSECGDCRKSSNQATKEVGSKKGQLSVPKIGETRAILKSYSQNQAQGPSKMYHLISIVQPPPLNIDVDHDSEGWC